MTYSDIKQQLFDGSTFNFYVFTGEELEVQSAYIHRIAESKNQVIKQIDSVKEAFKSKGFSLLDKSLCYVCRDDSEFMKAETTWSSVEDKVGNNTLIYLATKLDKRSKFYIFWESRILNFAPMTEQVLTKHIRKSVNLSVDNCKELIRLCESDYGRVLSETDKIMQFQQAHPDRTDDSCFMQLCDDGAIYSPPSDAIFDWVDAVFAGKPKRAFRLWQECIAIGEPSLRLLLVLYQGIKRLLQVQSCESKNISETTGLSQWEINLVKDYVNVYHTGELVQALRLIKALETDIKTGQVDEEYTVPYAMIRILTA